MKAFIFDLDGTLIDSLADLAEAINRMLVENGYPPQPMQVFPRYIGDGVKALVERAIPAEALPAENLDARVADYQRHYTDTWHDKTTPYMGIIEVLEELQSRDIKLAVLSNKPQAFTQLCCDHFFPQTKFHAVIGARDGVPRKPHPAGALEICQILDVQPSECVYIGDSGIDMELAVNAGMFPAGVSWGFRGEAELLAHGAQLIVRHPDDLLCLVADFC